MAVSPRTNTPAGTPPPSVPATEQAANDQGASVALELALHKRYVLHDVLYEADIVYKVSAEMAEYLLQRKSDFGVPIFKRYVPRVKRAINEDGMPTVDLRAADLPPRLTTTQQQKIEMGKASELVEAGIELPDDAGVEV